MQDNLHYYIKQKKQEARMSLIPHQITNEQIEMQKNECLESYLI